MRGKSCSREARRRPVTAWLEADCIANAPERPFVAFSQRPGGRSQSNSSKNWAVREVAAPREQGRTRPAVRSVKLSIKRFLFLLAPKFNRPRGKPYTELNCLAAGSGGESACLHPGQLYVDTVSSFRARRDRDHRGASQLRAAEGTHRLEFPSASFARFASA